MLIQKIFSDDAPVRVIKNDLLGRHAFVETLASALLLPPGANCRVVSLEGAWGEGKTSAIEMALDVVGLRDADLKPFVVRINPWQIGGQDSLVRALLLELSIIARGESRKKKVREFAILADELISYANAISLLKVEPHSQVLLAVARVFLWIAVKLARRQGDLQSWKQRVSSAIEKAGRPIIVVVDDLDRLLPAEVVEVMRFVRAVGDFERTTYLLAYDHPRVVEALSQAGVPSPDRFLEKIVQLRTHLPPANEKALRRILDSRLEESLLYASRRCFDESESRRLELYSFYLAPLIRDVRTLHRILARTEMTPKDVVREVEYWDVFALNTVSVVAPELFELVRTSPTGFIKNSVSIPSVGEKQAPDDMVEHVNAIIDGKLPRRAAPYVRGLVQSLFPVLTKRQIRSSSWMDRNGRIGAERPLLTYLISGILEGEIPLDTVRAILTEKKFRNERIAVAVHQEEQFLSLVSSLRDELAITKLTAESPGSLALLLITKSLELPKPESMLGLRIRDRNESMLPLIVELLAQEADPSKAISDLMKVDRNADFATGLIEGLMHPSTEALIRLKDKVPQESLDLYTEELASKVYFLIKNAEAEHDEQLTVLAHALNRIDPSAFVSMVKKLLPSSKERQNLMKALFVTRHSSHHGWIAEWNAKVVPSHALRALKDEAEHVVASSSGDKFLVAAAKALVKEGAVVVSTGQSLGDLAEEA